MRRSVFEGACYALMVGLGDLYIVADGVRLGASILQLGLLVALPLSMGAFGPWLSLRLMRAGRSRRRVAVVGATGQALSYGSMAACQAFDVLTPSLLIALAVLVQMCGQSTGVAWASWFGDLVPEKLRGRYFSRRNRVVHATTCVGAISGGVILQLLEPTHAGGLAMSAGGRGFVVLFAGAAAARLVSMVLLARTHEARLAASTTPPAPIREVFRNSEPARRVLFVTVGMMIGVWTAAPYFAAFMLEDLNFSYIEYTISTVSVVVATVLVLPMWGAAIDRKGPRGPYIVALLGIAIVPIPWFFAHGLALVIPAQLLSGSAWSGHELSQFTSLLSGSEGRDRARVFATVNAASGLAQLTGTLIGSALIGVGGFRLALAVTLVSRLLVSVWAAASLPTIAAHRRTLVLRLIGIRWPGGLRHRPVFDSSSSEGTPIEPPE